MTHTNEDLLALADRLDGIEIYSVREHLSGLGTRPIEAANNAVCEAATALRTIVAERQKPQAVRVNDLRVAMVTSSLASTAEDENCGGFPDEPCVVLAGSPGAVQAAAKLFGESVVLAALDVSEPPAHDHQRDLVTADERQAIRDRALDDAAQAASNRAAYWWNEATAADDAGRKKLSLIYEAKALACTELAAAIRVMKGKPE